MIETITFYRVILITFTIVIYHFTLRIHGMKFTASSFFSTFIGMFTMSFVFVHGLVPIYQAYFPYSLRLDEYSDYEVLESALISGGYYICFSIGYILFSSIFHPSKSNHLVNLELKKVKLPLLVVVGTPVLISLMFIFSLVTSMNVSELLVNRISLFRGLGGILLLSNLLIFIAAFYFLSFLEYNSRWDFFVFFVFFVIMIVVFTMIGSRNSLFIFLVFNLSVYCLVGKKINIWKTMTYSGLFLVFFVLVGVFRVRLDSGVDDNLLTSISDNLVHSVISVFGTDEIITYLIKNDFSDWQYGTTFLASITNFVPRGIWAEKPLGAGPLLTNFINPGSYGLSMSNVSSYTTGIISETYINFGYFGIFIVPFIHAFIGNLIVSIRSVGYFSLVMKAYLYVMFGFVIFYSEFLGMIARSIYVLLPIIALYFYFERKERFCRES